MRLFLAVICLLGTLVSYTPGSLTYQCGNTPQAPTCNIPRCTQDGWVFFPVARGTACKGGQGLGKCDGGELGPPGLIEPLRLGQCIPIANGSFDPQYYVLHVVYAPPGTAGPGPRSSVTYSDGSTLGTETKTNSSFKTDVSVTAEANLLGFEPLSASAGYAVNTVSERGLVVSKAESISITMQGGITDGINHDEDAIYLWLNPRVNVSSVFDELKWTFGVNGPTMSIQYVHVGWLKDPATMPPGVADQLRANLITEAHYPEILTHDPFAGGGTTIDTSRFVQTTTSFPYEPPFAPGAPPLTYTLKVDNQTTTSQTSSKTKEYRVGLKATLGIGIIEKLIVSTQFTWTNSSASTSRTTATESASVTVTGPSFGYTGPTNLAVYYDTFYNTFLFAPIGDPLAISGVIKTNLGRPARHQPITLTVNGVKYHTVSGRNGEYRFFGVPKGAAKLNAGGLIRSINIGTERVRQDLKLPRSRVNRWPRIQ